MNDCRENRKMLTKLPKWLIRRWRRIVSNSTHSYPSFSELCLFVNNKADICCNPILCSLQETEDERIKPEKKYMCSVHLLLDHKKTEKSVIYNNNNNIYSHK